MRPSDPSTRVGVDLIRGLRAHPLALNHELHRSGNPRFKWPLIKEVQAPIPHSSLPHPTTRIPERPAVVESGCCPSQSV